MTQYYKMPGFSLSNANASTKVLLTLFLVVVVGGLSVALLQYAERAGFGRKATLEWVRGNDDDPAAREIRTAKSYRELLSITHEHAFALPMLLFVLLHLVALCTIGEKAKIAIYVTGFLSLVGSLAAPWLIAYAGPGFSVLLRVSGVGLTGTIATSALLCLYETWLAGPIRRWRGEPDPKPPDPLVRRAA